MPGIGREPGPGPVNRSSMRDGRVKEGGVPHHTHPHEHLRGDDGGGRGDKRRLGPKKKEKRGGGNKLQRFALCSWSYPGTSLANGEGDMYYPILYDYTITRVDFTSGYHDGDALTFDLQDCTSIGTVEASVTGGTVTGLEADATQGHVLPNYKIKSGHFLRLDIIDHGTSDYVTCVVHAKFTNRDDGDDKGPNN